MRAVPLDLAKLERKLQELQKKIDEALFWAYHTPPPVGLKFEGQVPVVSGVMPHAADAGVKPGDVVVKVNGARVANVATIGRLAKGNVVELTLARGDKVTIAKQEMPTLGMELYSLAQIKRQAGEFSNKLGELKAQEQQPQADRRTLAAEASRLDAGIDAASLGVETAQMRAYNEAFESCRLGSRGRRPGRSGGGMKLFCLLSREHPCHGLHDVQDGVLLGPAFVPDHVNESQGRVASRGLFWPLNRPEEISHLNP